MGTWLDSSELRINCDGLFLKKALSPKLESIVPIHAEGLDARERPRLQAQHDRMLTLFKLIFSLFQLLTWQYYTLLFHA